MRVRVTSSSKASRLTPTAAASGDVSFVTPSRAWLGVGVRVRLRVRVRVRLRVAVRIGIMDRDS